MSELKFFWWHLFEDKEFEVTFMLICDEAIQIYTPQLGVRTANQRQSQGG